MKNFLLFIFLISASWDIKAQDAHIELSTPFENILISLKTDSVELFRDAFSKHIIGEDTTTDKWHERLEEAKGKLGFRSNGFHL